MSKQSLRQQMPVVTAFVDDLRNVFGVEMVDGQMRKGLNGKPTFWAYENGHEIGTRDKSAKTLVMWDDNGISFTVDIPEGATIRDELQLKRLALDEANARGRKQ